MNIRQEQRKKRREEILLAATDLFIRKGYAATKISDIAERVGMGAGLLFHYFESKEALYKELITLGVAGPTNMMAALADLDPLGFFKEAAERIFRYLKTDQYTAKMFVLMGQVFYNDGVPESVKELIKGFDVYTPTSRLIEKGQAEGAIREGDPYALAIAFWSAVQGVAGLIAINPQLPCPESGWIVDIIRRPK